MNKTQLYLYYTRQLTNYKLKWWKYVWNNWDSFISDNRGFIRICIV